MTIRPEPVQGLRFRPDTADPKERVYLILYGQPYVVKERVRVRLCYLYIVLLHILLGIATI